MSTTPVLDTEQSPDRQEGSARPWYRRPAGLARAAGVALAVSTFGVWVYAFSGSADRPPPDLLADATFGTRAETICAAAMADLAALPQAGVASSGVDRAAQVRMSTDRLGGMLDDLDQLVGGSARDVQITTEWLGDWRTLLADRYRYADAVASDPAAPFLLTDIGGVELVDKRITRLADTNHMPSCGAPDDVG